MASYICSKCCELDEHSIYEDIECKIGSLNNNVRSLKIRINKLTVKCENSMRELECCFFRILNNIGVKHKAYHGNIFVDNHCKLILVKDKDSKFTLWYSVAIDSGKSFQFTSQMFLWLETFMNWLLMSPVLWKNIKELASLVKRRGKVSIMLLTWRVVNLWVFDRRIYS